MTETFMFILDIIIVLFMLKTLWVGSDFNIWYWYKYGKDYVDWYNKRPKYKPSKEK